MSELLAPAGNMEALIAAVANGADAVYLGMQRFGARAYSCNFDQEGVRQAVAYCHLRGVKVYVTVNTIVFQDELADVFAQLDFLNEAGVDGVIAQDPAVIRYIVSNFENLEAHCSTQMGIDDVEGAQLARELGAKRVVVARETPLDQVRRIRKEAHIPVEVFVHGALCVSYSGNCIMSGLTGNRLGNRGRCIGSCRKLYDVMDVTDPAAQVALGRNYILSTKDLCTIDHAADFAGIDSLKIEGRMKEPVYVANVVGAYRKALDGTGTAADAELLTRTFNRTYTPGYLFGEDRGSITNVERPNNYGFAIGTVGGWDKRLGMYRLDLTAPLNQNDVIRIRHADEDVNLSVAMLHDAKGLLVNSASDVCYIKLKERLSAGDAVFKTKDVAFTKELENRLTGEYRRFPLDVQVYAYPGGPLSVEAQAWGIHVAFNGTEVLSEAKTRPTTYEAVRDQLDRLNDTVFQLGTVEYMDHNAFVPAKMLNEARRAIVEDLYRRRLDAKPRAWKLWPDTEAPVAVTAAAAPYLTAVCATAEQQDACLEAGLTEVFFDRNVVPRNSATYEPRQGQLLVGGLGGIQAYRGSNPFVTDYSLNVVNATTVALLHRLGARRVTLSYELTQAQLEALVAAYHAENGANAALEMVVYGRAPLLVTKYCPLKQLGQCGTCKTHRYEIREEYGAFPLLNAPNCDTTVLNGKVLNLLDQMPTISGVEAFRLNFTTETADEVRAVIAKARGKLDGSIAGSVFNGATDTRGHWNKEIM